jgi:hypothetical protein
MVESIAPKVAAAKTTTVKAAAKTTISEAATVKTAATKAATAAVETATAKVTATTAVETAAAKSATAAVTPATATATAAAVPKRPCGRTQHKQRGANYTKYSFCFHTLTFAPAAYPYHCESVGFCDASLE